MAFCGAVLGALSASVMYGLIGMVAACPPLALSIGAISGGLAIQFGGQRDVRVGTVAATASLLGVLAAEWLLIGGPGSFWETNGTLLNVVFSYVGSPLLAFLVSSGAERHLGAAAPSR